MDVLAARERLAQLRLAGDVREDAQLDLRVVGGEQAVPGLRDERGADLAAELGADRDRLQVGARRREAAGRGDGLVDRRVEAPVVADQRRQRAEVGVHELRQLAPLLDHGNDLVVGADRAEHLRVGRVAGLALAAGRELELLEEDPAELLRRPEHELLAREVVGARLELLDPVVQAGGDLPHAVRVDAHAGVLHRREDDGERELDLAIQALRTALGDLREERLGEAASGLGVPDERGRLLLRRRIGLELDRVLGHEVVELVLGAARVDQVGEEHRVLGDGLAEPQRLRVVRRPRRGLDDCLGDPSLPAHRL